MQYNKCALGGMGSTKGKYTKSDFKPGTVVFFKDGDIYVTTKKGSIYTGRSKSEILMRPFNPETGRVYGVEIGLDLAFLNKNVSKTITPRK